MRFMCCNLRRPVRCSIIASKMPPAEPARYDLNALEPAQLNQLRERLDGDIEQFASSGNLLARTKHTFETSQQAIQTLDESKAGQPTLLPLTQSLYVSGSLASTDRILVDIGTGYYVEMTTAEGKDYCSRKIAKLESNLKGLQQILREKQNQLIQVQQVLADKLASRQAQQPQQA